MRMEYRAKTGGGEGGWEETAEGRERGDKGRGKKEDGRWSSVQRVLRTLADNQTEDKGLDQIGHIARVTSRRRETAPLAPA